MKKNKVLALLLALAILLGAMPLAVLAAEEGAGCTHAHDTTCGFAEAVACGHLHSEACGHSEGTPEIPCDMACEEGAHAEGCAYAPAVAGTPCNHTGHDAACGFAEAAPCTHQHDEACGGLPAQAPQGGETDGQPLPVTVAKLDTLADEVLWQGFDAGEIESQAEIDLPGTLAGEDADGAALAIENVSWACTAAETMLGEAFETTAFDPEREGRYTFAPALPAGYTLGEGVALPEISVIIRSGGMMPMNTPAGQRFEYDGLIYEVLTNSPQRTVKVYYCDPDLGRSTVSIPAMASDGTDEYLVTEIGTYAFSQAKLTTLDLSGATNLKVIGAQAFYGCFYLAGTVRLPPSVTTIGASAFELCDTLEEIVFPANGALASIGESAFSGCTTLRNAGAIPAGVTSIGNYAFYRCTKLTDLDLSGAASLETIGDYAFEITALTGTLTIPANVTTIGDQAFARTSISTLRLPANGRLSVIGREAFRATALSGALTIPASVTSIGEAAFQALFFTSLVLPETGSLTIGEYAFDSNPLTGTLTIPSSVTSIGEGAFKHCKDITALVLPETGSLTIGAIAFENTGLSGPLTIPASVTSIGGSAFAGLSGITALSLPETGNLAIGNRAFANTGLTGALTIPSSVTGIGGNAFSGTAISGSLTLPQSLTLVDSGAFANTLITSADLRSFSGALGNGVFSGCTYLSTLSFSASPAPQYAAAVFSGMRATGTVNYPSGAAGYTKTGFAEGELNGWTFTPYTSQARTFTAVQTGGISATTTSTAITLTFSAAVENLTAPNIRVQSGTGAVRLGALSGSGAIWTLALSDVPLEGNVTVSVANFGTYIVSTTPQTVAVFRAITPPGQPRDLSVRNGNGTVTLTWAAPLDDGGMPITKYEVTSDSGTTWVTAGSNTSHTFTGLTNGTEYTCAVRAVNGKGAGDLAAIHGNPVGTPGAPTGFTVTPGDGRLVLKWTGPASNGGSAITRYQVYRSPGPDAWVDIPWSSASTVETTLTSLTNGTAYTVKVRAKNVAGGGTATQEITATPAAKPTAPQSLAATPGNGQVALVWEAPANSGGATITKYEVSKDGGTSWEDASSSTGHTFTGLTNGTAYSFAARAVNSAGNGAQAEVMATPSATAGVPLAPRSFAAAPGNGQVALTWLPPASNGGAAITKYQVSKDGGTSWGDAASATGHTFTGLTNGTAYSFAVRAVNSVGNGAQATAAATPALIPGAPQKLTTTPGNGQIVLSWVAPASNGGSPITHYEVSKDGTSWETATGSLSHTFTDLTNGTVYTLRVRAVNAAGAGAQASVASKPMASPMVPGAPQNLIVTPGDGKLGLSWDPPASNNGSEITKYQYSVSTGADDWKDVPFNFITSISVSSLQNGTTYTVKVRAVNAKGAGFSINSTGKPSAVATAPAAPTNLAVQPGNGQLALSWETPGNGGSAITKYQVSVSTDGSETWQDIPSSGPSTTSHTLTGLTNGTAHTVKLRAVNAVGGGTAVLGYGTPVAAPTVPEAPVSLVATPGDGELALHWITPSNGGSAITKYQVSVSTGADNWQDIPSSGPSTTSHTVTGLTNGTEYTVKLLAVNGVGNGAEASTTGKPQEPAAPLAFADSATYDIPPASVGTAIASIDVSGGASGGTTPYTFTASGLPAGIEISTGGVISGTPTVVKTAGTATITVTDGVNSTASITIAYGAIAAAPTPVGYVAVQDGGASCTANTTGIKITFSEAVTRLTAADITVTGATKGALTGSGITYTLGISDITADNGGNITIAIANFGTFAVSPAAPQNVVVYKLLTKLSPPTTANFYGNTMQLLGVTASMKYSLDGGATYTVCGGDIVELSAVPVYTAYGIRVIRPGNGTATADSDPRVITLTQNSIPAGVSKTDETAASANDGTLTGVGITMQYRQSGAGNWSSISGTTVSGLAPGTYEVRTAGGFNTLPSEAVFLTILAYGAPAPELIGITQPTAITGLANGTPKTAATLGLPTTVAITTTNGGPTSASVTWNVAACSYDPTVTAAQDFSVNGTVALPVGVGNSGGVSLGVTISVSVKAQAPVAITGISIVSPPTKTSYFTGNVLALAGLSVKLSYSDGTDETVAFAQFSQKGITTSPQNGSTLAKTNFGVQISAGGFSVTQPIVVVDPIVPTYTATLTVNKDGTAWPAHGKSFTLKLITDESVTYTLTGTGANLTATVPGGVWKVYDGTAYTGQNITISSANGSVTVQYYTITYSVSNVNDAAGSTISASYGGLNVASGAVVVGGKTLIVTATGQGATTYTYAWGGTASGTTNTYSTTVTAKVNATCTVAGTATGVTVSGIAVASQPSLLSYVAGDTLDLTGLTVTLSLSDGSTKTVGFADFGTWGISIQCNGEVIAHGTELTTAQDGKPLVLTVNGHAAQTSPLIVGAAPVKHAIVATAGTGGSIAPSGTVMVVEGGSQTFTITAHSGYKIQDVVVDGHSVGAVSSHTFSNVTAGHTIQAMFEKTDTDPDNPHTYQTLRHEGTGVIVKVYAASNVVLVVTQGALHDEGTCPACDSIRRSTNMIALYDISIQGEYSGNIEVSIPVPSAYNGQTVVVRHCKGSQLEEVVLTVQDSYVTGTFSSLSPFAVFATGDTNGHVPQTGDTSNLWLWLSLMILALLAAGLAVCMYIKRRRIEGN